MIINIHDDKQLSKFIFNYLKELFNSLLFPIMMKLPIGIVRSKEKKTLSEIFRARALKVPTQKVAHPCQHDLDRTSNKHYQGHSATLKQKILKATSPSIHYLIQGLLNINDLSRGFLFYIPKTLNGFSIDREIYL